MEERIISAGEQLEDWELDASLRPRALAEFVGQERIKENLDIFIKAARGRGEALDHVLLHGPPGLGKTTLARIIAAELGVDFRITSGPALERPGDLASILTSLGERDVLFIDEIHRLPRSVEEILYPAMEDFSLDIILGKGPTARSLRLDLSPFTLIGATTRAGLLTSPLRDRFGILCQFEFYTRKELGQIITRAANILAIAIDSAGAKEIARRARGTPRVANRLLKRVRDFAQVRAEGFVDLEVAQKALVLLDVDDLGLDGGDRRLLLTILEKFDGGPVGLDTLAAALSEEAGTIEEVYEPYLLQMGLLQRTPRGRLATRRAWEHLQVDPGGQTSIETC